ncbi:MAG: hypothetical protein HFJ33_01745 [Clostridia bacterium]|nr:hypothetical protein [Clostridia bacterium]
MYNFNKKQKIILGILITIVIAFICYYVYAKEEESMTEFDLQDNMEASEIQSNEETKQQEEKYSDDRIVIHVSGAVNKEGIVELKVNSRISDAIDQAGGIREDASIEEINLAYKLEDGMKIHIPTKQEKQQKEITNQTNISEVTTTSGIMESNKTEEKTERKGTTKVNINTATQTQLETLPGIGPSTAIKIMTYRKEKGKFSKIEEIKEVNGIGDSKYDKIKDFICI